MNDIKIQSEIWFTYPGIGYSSGKKYIKISAFPDNMSYVQYYNIPLFEEFNSKDAAREHVFETVKEMIELYIEYRESRMKFYWLSWFYKKVRPPFIWLKVMYRCFRRKVRKYLRRLIGW